MAIIETPGLLIGGEESDYLAKYKEIFDGHNEIIIPECPDKKSSYILARTDIANTSGDDERTRIGLSERRDRELIEYDESNIG